MKDLDKKLTLSNGVEIPILGFGTYKIEDDCPPGVRGPEDSGCGGQDP